MSRNNHWRNLDAREMLARRDSYRNEATTSANVGAYPVPLGTPMRNPFPTPVAGSDTQQMLAGLGDEEYRRALKAMGWLD